MQVAPSPPVVAMLRGELTWCLQWVHGWQHPALEQMLGVCRARRCGCCSKVGWLFVCLCVCLKLCESSCQLLKKSTTWCRIAPHSRNNFLIASDFFLLLRLIISSYICSQVCSKARTQLARQSKAGASWLRS